MQYLVSNAIWDVFGPMVERRGSPPRPEPRLPDRVFLEPVLHRARTECSWRDLRGEFGAWDAACNRLRPPIHSGRLTRLSELMAERPVCERLITKVIAATRDEYGVVAAGVAKGHRHDAVLAGPVLAEAKAAVGRIDAVLADKGFEADAVRGMSLEVLKALPVIPKRRGRREPSPGDDSLREAYKRRNRAEQGLWPGQAVPRLHNAARQARGRLSGPGPAELRVPQRQATREIHQHSLAGCEADCMEGNRRETMKRRCVILGALVFVAACSPRGMVEGLQVGRQKGRARTQRDAGVLLGPSSNELKLREARSQLERERYKGIVVHANALVDKRHASVQRALAVVLTRLDFVPKERLNRFAWIPQRMNTKITGWDARIVDITPAPGGVVARVRVTPMHDGNAGLATSDYSLETYLFDGTQIRYVGAEFHPTGGVVVFN